MKIKAYLLFLLGMAPAFAAGVAPLYFGGVNAADQQSTWDYMTKFKIWGTEGITLGNRPTFPDPSGWIGTASVGITGGEAPTLGGPIIVGGNITAQQGSKFMTGPVRTSGSFTSSRDHSPEYHGTVCVGGSYDGGVQEGVSRGNGILLGSGNDHSGVCADSLVPPVRSEVAIPSINAALSGYSGSTNYSGTITVPNSGVYYLDIPPGASSDVYDIFLNTLKFNNEGTLYVRMPAGGRLTRIFLESLQLANHPVIQVYYVGEDAVWDGSRYTSVGTNPRGALSISEYKGNLLFYVPHDLTFSNTDNVPIEGTFISTGTISLQCNMKFAGQILGKKVNIGNEIDGSSFIYMPFDPPVLKLVPEVGTTLEFPENDQYVQVPIKLDIPAKVNVGFNYCFRFGSGTGFASEVDVDLANSTEPYKFPRCALNQKDSVFIPDGKDVPQTDNFRVWLKVLVDDLPEGNELLYLVVKNLSGAVMPGNVEEGEFALTLVDGDREPKTKSDSIVALEDEIYTFSASKFYFSSIFADEAGMVIKSLPDKGTLMLGEEAITEVGDGLFVSLESLEAGDLKYIGAPNGYNMQAPGYSSFTFKMKDNLGYYSKGDSVIAIYVAPVNDGPQTENTTITFGEISHTVTGALTVTDIDDNSFTYSFDTGFDETFTQENYNKVMNLYTINSATGEISVRNNAVLDYEQGDRTLNIKVRIIDDAATTNGVGRVPTYSVVTLTIVDENEMFTYSTNGTFSVPENTVPSDPIGSILLDDPDTENADFRKDAFEIVSVTDEHDNNVTAQGYFSIEETTPYSQIGNLFVEKELDYEASKSYTVVVRAYDETLDEYSENIIITVNVEDVNEPPTIVNIQDSYNELEHVATGDVFGTILITDQDGADVQSQFVVTLEELNRDAESSITDAADLFAVTVAENSEDQKLYIVLSVKDSAKLNYETLFNQAKDTASFDVRIHLTDRAGTAGSNSVYADTKIYVTDVNEAPIVTSWGAALVGETWTPFDVDENSAVGTLVGQVVANDLDIWQPAYGTLYYTIDENVDGDATNNVPFAIDEHGNITVAGVLNHEENSSWTFNVTVTDNTYPKTVSVTVNVNDVNENPEFSCQAGDENCNGPFSINEHVKTNTVIHSFDVSDEDGPGVAGLTPTLTDNNGTGADSLFAVVRNGNVVSIVVKDSAKLNYEFINATHEVTITITDEGNLTDTLIRTINVVDINEAPTIDDATFTPDENIPNGTVVGALNAFDPDTKNVAFSTLTYTIVEEGAPFRMDSNKVVVSNSSMLNYETNPTIVVRVRVTDGTFADTAVVTVNLQDVNEVPEFSCQAGDENCNGPFSINEHVKTNTVIHSFDVSDEDGSGVAGLTPTLTDNNGTGADSLFAVVRDGNVVSIVVKDSARLNYEFINATHEVTITITDEGGLKDTLIRTINVVDINEAPTIDDATFTPDENIPNGTVVGTLNAFDPDTKNVAFSTLTYTIVEESSPFTMDSNKVVVANSEALDYETNPTIVVHVRVTDGTFADTAVVTVNLQDVNEVPEFSCLAGDENCNGPFSINEHVKTNTLIHSFNVSDQDGAGVSGLTPTLTDKNGTGADSLFAVVRDGNVVSIVVKDSVKLNYENINVDHEVVITITDIGGLKDTLIRTINVVDINEAPTIDDATFTPDENSPNGTVVGALNAFDPDVKHLKEFGTLTYTIVENGAPFTMDSNKVVVSNSSMLNYETNPTIVVHVRVTDGTFADTATVIVNLQDVNENPEFSCQEGDTNCNGPFSVKEHVETGTIIHSFNVSDQDGADVGKLHPSLADNGETGADSLFDVTLVNGVVNIVVKDSVKLNYETINVNHEVVITITDDGGLTDTLIRTINVVDINEAPTIADASFEPDENAANGTVVGVLDAFDPDVKHLKEFGTLTYTVIENGAPFTMDSNKVVVSNSAALDYETNPVIVVHVRVTDGMYADTAVVTVSLQDVNEYPEFACQAGDNNCNGPFNVNENVNTGTVVHSFDVSDQDGADAGKLTVSLADNGKTGADSLFDVTIADNVVSIVVKDGSKLDYEKINETHEVVITVTDVGGLTDTLVRTINVVDVNEAPTIADAEFTPEENSPNGTVVGELDAFDPDVKHLKEFGTLEYTVITDGAPFTMDSNKVVVSNSSALDYETDSVIVVYVRVTDGTFADTAKVTVKLVDVNEKPVIVTDENDDGEDDEIEKCKKNDNCITDPGDPEKITVGIKENSATDTEVLSYKVEDQDAGDVQKLTAVLVDVNSTGADTLFKAAVENVGGDDYRLVVRVIDEAKLDYETVNESYDVLLKIVDEDGAEDSIVRTIKVIDVNEAPTIADAEFTPDENAPNGTVVGNLDAHDPDVKHLKEFGTLYYFVIEEDAPFEMDSNKVVVSNSSALDYEKDSVITIHVRVTDGTYSDTAKVTVKLQDVNENPVIITDEDDNGEDDEIDKCKKNDNCANDPEDKKKIVVTIEENSATDTEVLSYKVEDQDAGDNDGLTATMTDMNGDGADSLFKIAVEKSGDDYRIVVRVADSSKLDYESIKQVYDVLITVADEGGLTDSIVRTIKVLDVNENPVIAKQTFEFNEHESENTVVGKLESSDLDTAKVFTQNEYTAIGGDTTLFDVSKDGTITTTKEFNFESEPHEYVVVVKVSDKNDPSLFDVDTMKITLNNIPETPHIKSTDFDVDENVPDSTKIGTIVAHDPDGKQTLTYELVEKSDYVIVTTDGDILVKDGDLFDFETIQEIEIKVRVTDPDSLSSDTTIVITVKDVNEAPEIKNQKFDVDENAKENTTVGQIVASDPDTAKAFSTLTYELVGESDEFKVTKNGTIKTTKPLDYETDSVYTIKVRVTDGEFSDTATVTIHVNDKFEATQVEIVEADNRDSCWNKKGVDKCSVLKDTIYTNLPDMNIEWTVNGVPQTPDGEKLHEGVNVIIKTYDDPTMNVPGADTLVIVYSTAAPIVTVSTKIDTVVADNIFTVVEQVDEKDTNVYVNDPKKDIRVTVTDTVLGTTESFIVKLDLDTLDIPKKNFEKANDIVESGIALNIKPASEMNYTPVNGSEIKVSYTEKVNGETVTVSYVTDNDGEVKKTAVLTSEGTIDSIEVITVSYVTNVDGKEVTLSYKADAITGDPLLMTTDGGLMTVAAAESFTGEGRWDDVGDDSDDDNGDVEDDDSKGGKSGGKSSGKSSSSTSDKGKSSSSKSDGGKSGKSKYTVTGLFSVTYDYEDPAGNTVTVSYTADEKGAMVKNAEGNIGYNVSYSYTNIFGNTASQAVFIVIDQIGPVVEILSPVEQEVIYTNSVEVLWTVNGIVQDTLALQGLDKGANGIIRFYCDKAGNCDSSIVYVIMKNAKDVDISVEKPVTTITQDLVDEYYEANPPKKGETFAVSIKNAQTGKEVETLIGGEFGSKEGSDEAPYPGLEGHLGPTLGIDVRVPTYGGTGSGKAILSGLATFDELVGKDGLVNADGVDAANAKKLTVEEYVEEYCTLDFMDSLGTDFSRASLYKTTMYVNVWVYTSLGSFVDYFSFSQDLNDPDYADDAGLLKLYFEMKPDKEGYVVAENGKRYATGSYVYKTEVEMRSVLQCTLPPVDKEGKDANKKGSVRKVSDNLLKSFGYRRPENR